MIDRAQAVLDVPTDRRVPQWAKPLPLPSSAEVARAIVALLRGRIYRATFDRVLTGVPG